MIQSDQRVSRGAKDALGCLKMFNMSMELCGDYASLYMIVLGAKGVSGC